MYILPENLSFIVFKGVKWLSVYKYKQKITVFKYFEDACTLVMNFKKKSVFLFFRNKVMYFLVDAFAFGKLLHALRSVAGEEIFVFCESGKDPFSRLYTKRRAWVYNRGFDTRPGWLWRFSVFSLYQNEKCLGPTVTFPSKVLPEDTSLIAIWPTLPDV